MYSLEEKKWKEEELEENKVQSTGVYIKPSPAQLIPPAYFLYS
jgi:hypothetical protein